MTPGVKSGFLVLLVLGVGAQSVTKYFENNGTLVLDPKVSEPITSITWKHDGNIVAEWIKDKVPLEYLGDFKSRSKVDLTTGVLTIRGIKKAEEGPFTVEINGRERPGTFTAVGIRNLKGVKVEVVVRPLTCSSASETCNLDCRGDFTDAEPVRFFWREGDKGRWEEKTKNITIFNNEETKKIESFSCKAKNPLGETEESKAEKNLLTQKASGGDSGGAIAGGIIVGLIVVAAVGVGGYFYHKRQQRQRLNVIDLENGSGSNAMDHSLSAMEQDKGQTEAASTDAQNAEEKRPLTGPSATENSNNKPEHEKPNHDS